MFTKEHEDFCEYHRSATLVSCYSIVTIPLLILYMVQIVNCVLKRAYAHIPGI